MEEDECSVEPSSLARLVIQSGDECLRQKLVQAVKGKERSSTLSSANSMFVKDFPNQEKVVTGVYLQCTCTTLDMYRSELVRGCCVVLCSWWLCSAYLNAHWTNVMVG